MPRSTAPLGPGRADARKTETSVLRDAVDDVPQARRSGRLLRGDRPQVSRRAAGLRARPPSCYGSRIQGTICATLAQGQHRQAERVSERGKEGERTPRGLGDEAPAKVDAPISAWREALDEPRTQRSARRKSDQGEGDQGSGAPALTRANRAPPTCRAMRFEVVFILLFSIAKRCQLGGLCRPDGPSHSPQGAPCRPVDRAGVGAASSPSRVRTSGSCS